MRLVWLMVVLAAVVEIAIATQFRGYLSNANCDAGDQAVCLVSLWLMVVLAAVVEIAIATQFRGYLSNANCDAGDQAVCLVSLYFTEHN